MIKNGDLKPYKMNNFLDAEVQSLTLDFVTQFEQFVTYLKQRDRSGVVKLPASDRLWARMLYILPWSPETCSMLEISQQPSSCLIGIILPAPPSMAGS